MSRDGRIIYFYDALCGWCYGFSPVIERFYNEFRDRFEFETVSGGMILGAQAGAIGRVAPYISQAYKTVEQATGVRFGEQFLNEILAKGTANFSSFKPGVALAVFKKHAPERSIEFASALSKAIYRDGIEPDENESYKIYAEQFGLDAAQFVAQMSDKDSIEAALKDFQRTADLGINGFPTVLGEKDGRLRLLARGYTSFEQLQNNIL